MPTAGGDNFFTTGDAATSTTDITKDYNGGYTTTPLGIGQEITMDQEEEMPTEAAGPAIDLDDLLEQGLLPPGAGRGLTDVASSSSSSSPPADFHDRDLSVTLSIGMKSESDASNRPETLYNGALAGVAGAAAGADQIQIAMELGFQRGTLFSMGFSTDGETHGQMLVMGPPDSEREKPQV